MDSRLRGKKGVGGGREQEGTARPGPAPPPWVPAFAGMTKYGGGNDEVGGRGDEVGGGGWVLLVCYFLGLGVILGLGRVGDGGFSAGGFGGRDGGFTAGNGADGGLGSIRSRGVEGG